MQHSHPHLHGAAAAAGPARSTSSLGSGIAYRHRVPSHSSSSSCSDADWVPASSYDETGAGGDARRDPDDERTALLAATAPMSHEVLDRTDTYLPAFFSPTANGVATTTTSEDRWRTAWDTLKVRARYYVPALSWMPAYSRADLVHDAIAGSTVAFVLIPQGLSYASSLAKLEPVVGLYTAAFAVVVYGFFGTSRQLSIGPEALVSILVGSAVSKTAVTGGAGASPDPAEAAAITGTLCLLVGLFTFALGFFRFGFIDSVLSRALLRGFISAVAIVIMVEQGPSLLGIPPPDATHGGADDEEEMSPFDKIVDLASRAHRAHLPTLFVSLASVTFLVGAAWVKQRVSQRHPGVRFVPEILLLVILAILGSWSLDLEAHHGVAVLGAVKSSGIPAPSIPALRPFSTIRSLTIPAILISVLGFVESIVVTKQYAALRGYGTSRNRELVALGVANIAGAFFHAFPAFGSLARSRVNDRVGARTQLAGMIAGTLVLFAICFLLPAFYHLPKAAMASIILVAAFSLIETHDIHFILRLRAWRDFGLLLFTFFTTILVSIEAGILLSIALSLLLVVKDVAVPRITILGRVRDHHSHSRPATAATTNGPLKYRPVPTDRTHSPVPPRDPDDPDSPYARASEDAVTAGVVVIRLDEALHFANTGELRERLLRAERFGSMAAHPSEQPTRRHPLRLAVFDVRHMPAIDASAAQILAEIVDHYRDRGVGVAFVRAHPRVRVVLDRAGISEYARHVSRITDALHAVGLIQPQQEPAGVASEHTGIARTPRASAGYSAFDSDHSAGSSSSDFHGGATTSGAAVGIGSSPHPIAEGSAGPTVTPSAHDGSSWSSTAAAAATTVPTRALAGAYRVDLFADSDDDAYTGARNPFYVAAAGQRGAFAAGVTPPHQHAAIAVAGHDDDEEEEEEDEMPPASLHGHR
ncbi:hypothetical protein H9P43_008311 [Blastocladiella emersonii ATCC 22665]|nr:hypothetical protein H9P43_008311 [Blastocladiella emersonii ATCC 22665]